MLPYNHIILYVMIRVGMRWLMPDVSTSMVV